jgi:hypothetical protein
MSQSCDIYFVSGKEVWLPHSGLFGKHADVSREPKSMIWCESLTQRVYTSRASL